MCSLLSPVVSVVVGSSKSIYIGCRDPKSDQHKPFLFFAGEFSIGRKCEFIMLFFIV